MTDTQYSMTATHMIHELQGCENEQTQSAQDTEQVVETLQSCCTSIDTKAYGCKGFGRYELTDVAESLRASGGDNGGGSETIVYARKRR